MAVLLVMALAATIISFSLADNGDGNAVSDGDLVAANDNTSTALTTIDYIIRNSNDETSSDREYHIVEIGASAEASSLQSMVSSAAFEQYVLNEHGTLGELMAADKITYQYIQASTVSNTDARLADISNADLIYVSNSGGAYKVGNDIGEELYNLLHTYAVGDDKPLIIDSPTKSGDSEVIDKDKSITDLVKDYFAESGTIYYTYGWDTNSETTAEAYFTGDIKSNSMYLGINARKEQDSWTIITDASDDTVTKKVADFLVITNGTSTVRKDAIFNGVAAASGSYLGADGTAYDLTDVYDIDGSIIDTKAYLSRYSAYNPDFVKLTTVSLADWNSDANLVNLDQYDMIIMEDDCAGQMVTADVYKKLVAAMYANLHIVYNKSLGTASGSSDVSGGNLDSFNETNYSELFYMVATDKEIARYNNIMVTNKTEFDIIAGSNSASTCQTIADLINASTWRGINGGSSSNTYTVLEIQPVYPINTVMEAENSTYYTNPSEIINGQTAEQLGYKTEQVDANGTTTTRIAASSLSGNETEFYDWELSEAMVADALGMDASSVKVVHMSTEEFECNKDDILGTYDMIYIGGNTSALKSLTQRKGVMVFSWSTMSSASDTSGLPTYTMYSHNGDVIRLDFDVLGSAGNKTATGTLPIGKADLDTSGSKTFTTLSGNDLTYNNYLSLVEYVDAGMPVLFSDVASAGYTIAATDGYLQNTLDPDSNMYKFMKYCKLKSDKDNEASGTSSIQWDVDIDAKELTDNDGGILGSTKTGYVSVLTDENSALLDAAYSAGTKRPKLAITSKPAQYSLYDSGTKQSSRTLSFKYDVTGPSSYTVNLYIDDDGNSKFTSDELFESSTTSELTYDLGSFKGGPVYWKLEVTSGQGSNKQVVSTTGTAYITPEEDEKTEVNILQLIPSGSGVEGAQGVMSLYFCPECQRTYAQIDYNPLSVGVRTSDGALYASGDGTTSYGDQYTDSYGFENVTGRKIYMGKHNHTFGVVKYDSTLANTTGAPGRDDWDWNLADELSDQYEFDLDIMTSREYDALSLMIESYFDDLGYDSMTEEEKAAAISAEETKAAEALYNLNAFKEGGLKTAKADLDACLTSMIANCTNASDAAELQRLIDEGCYYDYFNIEGITTYNGSTKVRFDSYCKGEYAEKKAIPNTYGNAAYAAHAANETYSGFEYYYQVYVLATDELLRLEDEYKQANYKASYQDNWLLGSYDTIIIGPAENFNNDDLLDLDGVATLKDYVENDGSILLFHETLGRFADKGPSNLTAALLADFGNDPYHMELDTSLVGSAKVIESKNLVSSQNNLLLNFETSDGKTGQINIYDFDITAAESALEVTQSDWGGYSRGSWTKSGTMKTEGTVRVTVSFKLNSGVSVKSAKLGYTKYTYNPYAVYDVSADGVVSADGLTVTFDLPNYYISSQTYSASDVYYLPYKSVDATEYSTDKYFLTNLSYKTGNDRYYTWISDLKNYYGSFTSENRYFAPNLYSSSQFYASTSSNANVTPYKYGDLDWGLATKWANSAGSGDSSKAGTNKASQNNSGIITTYPFTLSSQLNISGTHPSAYALDVESDDMTVWYSLAGGTYERDNSALYAATPNDGVDNYFIYSYGNVYYCGAGHTKVTGQYKDNNDERRLYINIICNSVRNSVRQPSIDVYDYNTKDNKIIIKGDGSYIYEIDEDVEYPVFTFHPVVDDEANISQVNIYYKLSTSGSAKYEDGVDKYIVNWTGANVKSKDYVNVGKDIALLKLDDSYFAPYGGNYTYIVIEVVDDQGNVTYQKIKIVRKAHLFDLT